MEKFYNIKLLALTAVMAAAMTACSDSEPAAVGENAEANVVVTIKAAPSAPQSRSNDPWQGTQPEEEGKIDADNNINTLAIAIYDSETNALVGNVSNLIMLNQTEDGTRQYVGKLPVKDDGTDIIVKDKNYRVMVFTNCTSSYCNITDFSNPASLTFGRPTPHTQEVVMWGVKNPVTFTLNKQVAQEIGTIYLLRTMAKVEVKLSDDLKAKGYRLTGPNVKNANGRGMVLPTGWDTAADTKAINYEGAFNISGITEIGTLNPILSAFDNETYWRAYIPEIENGATTVNRPVIDINIRQKIDNAGNYNPVGAYTLQFGNYADGSFSGTYFNVVRNHIYRYEITGIGASGEITLNVNPWEDNNTTDWDYSNTVGVAEGDHLKWEPGSYQSIDDAKARLVMSTNLNTYASGTFRIASPIGAEWTAYLLPGENTVKDDFVFVDPDGNVITPSGTIADNSPTQTLRIKATKAPDANNSRSVTLRVVVRIPDGEPVTANLLVGHYGKGNTEFTLMQNPTM